MSIKENVSFIKHEMDTQEEFLSGFLKVEKYYKKYKNYLYIIGAVVVVAVVATVSMDYVETSNKLKANEAYNILMDNPDDKEAMATLQKSNTKLYDIVNYKDGSKTALSDELIYLKALVDFQKIKDKESINDINTLIKDGNFLLKDYAVFKKALILTKQGKLQQAKDSLKFIPKDSAIVELTNLLNHHLSANGVK